eukprot:gene17649-biopygen1724
MRQHCKRSNSGNRPSPPKLSPSRQPDVERALISWQSDLAGDLGRIPKQGNPRPAAPAFLADQTLAAARAAPGGQRHGRCVLRWVGGKGAGEGASPAGRGEERRRARSPGGERVRAGAPGGRVRAGAPAATARATVTCGAARASAAAGAAVPAAGIVPGRVAAGGRRGLSARIRSAAER